MIKNLLKLLNQHDWFYQYSDDHRQYKKGLDNAINILAPMVAKSSVHQAAYNAFRDARLRDGYPLVECERRAILAAQDALVEDQGEQGCPLGIKFYD